MMIEVDQGESLDAKYLALCDMLGDAIDTSELNNSEVLKAMASVVMRILAFKTEDRASAYELRDLFCGTVAHGFAHMDEAGIPIWSKSRMN